jgi:hypothetical protein
MSEYLGIKNAYERLVEVWALNRTEHNRARHQQAEACWLALKEAAGEGGPGDPACCQRYGKLHHPAFSVGSCKWLGLVVKS